MTGVAQVALPAQEFELLRARLALGQRKGDVRAENAAALAVQPIADAARAILDGHIVLDRRIADSGLYPAIDIERSVSRVVTEIADLATRERIRRLKRLMAAYSAQRDLIAIGAYQRGADPLVDEAIARWPAIQAFLGQDVHDGASLESSKAALAQLLETSP